MAKPEIYPPCGVRLGEEEPIEFICHAIVLEGEHPDNLRVDSILTNFCDAFVKEGSCPQKNATEYGISDMSPII